ncbi:MAG: YjdF family protein, partial [Ruminococcus sp.]|nr:YjdF family protein [Ruminococcus sp.]
MSTVPQSSLTILFEAPFWIGLYERTDNGKYEVCKITFGSEPKDYEVYEFLLKNWHKLKFSPPIQTEVAIERKINPKRMQREIQSQLQDKGIGTKAQQALK